MSDSSASPRRALAVWGDPIEHSRSPDLHGAAYRVLGLTWSYGRRRVDAAGFSEALASLDGSWRGLSLTMPLKEEAFRAAVEHDDFAQRTGAVNTLLLTERGPRGWNTDVGGIIRALDEQGIAEADSARIIGAGATATSALVACAALGVRWVEVVARRPEAVHALRPIAQALGVRLEAEDLASTTSRAPVSLTVSTLPGGVDVDGRTAAELATSGGALLDVVYGQGQTAVLAAWRAADAPAQTGEGMLLHQAVLQVRVFLSGDVNEPLPQEHEVIAAMRSALNSAAAH